MIILKYVLACVFGLILGWFGYDMQKAAFTAVMKRRGARHSAVEASPEIGAMLA